MMLSPIEKLYAIEEIKKLKSRYCRYLDAGDWQGFRSLLADNCVFGPETGDTEKSWSGTIDTEVLNHIRVEGADAIVEWVSQQLPPGSYRVHHAMLPDIEIISETEARAIWSMRGIVRGETEYGRSFGYYRESYVRIGDSWLYRSFYQVRTSYEIRNLAIKHGTVV